MIDTAMRGERTKRSWSVFSSPGLVLLYLARYPDSTMRAVSDALGLTERQIARIVKDLVAGGMVQVNRHGRRLTYSMRDGALLRHPSVRHVTVGRLLAAVGASAGEEQASGAQ